MKTINYNFMDIFNLIKLDFLIDNVWYTLYKKTAVLEYLYELNQSILDFAELILNYYIKESF
jgi:hypothetical protein